MEMLNPFRGDKHYNTEQTPITRDFLPGNLFSGESTEAMQIKRLAQGQ